MIIRSSTSGSVAAGYRSGERAVIAIWTPSGGGRTTRIEMSIGQARGLLEALTLALADVEAALGPLDPDRARGAA